MTPSRAPSRRGRRRINIQTRFAVRRIFTRSGDDDDDNNNNIVVIYRLCAGIRHRYGPRGSRALLWVFESDDDK